MVSQFGNHYTQTGDSGYSSKIQFCRWSLVTVITSSMTSSRDIQIRALPTQTDMSKTNFQNLALLILNQN